MLKEILIERKKNLRPGSAVENWNSIGTEDEEVHDWTENDEKLPEKPDPEGVSELVEDEREHELNAEVLADKVFPPQADENFSGNSENENDSVNDYEGSENTEKQYSDNADNLSTNTEESGQVYGSDDSLSQSSETQPDYNDDYVRRPDVEES